MRLIQNLILNQPHFRGRFRIEKALRKIGLHLRLRNAAKLSARKIKFQIQNPDGPFGTRIRPNSPLSDQNLSRKSGSGSNYMHVPLPDYYVTAQVEGRQRA